MFTNDYRGKKKLVEALSDVYKNINLDIASIELKKYISIYDVEEEFILLTWNNGAISTANNYMNSLAATARNVARMLDGGVYENVNYYKEIMRSGVKSEIWEEE